MFTIQNIEDNFEKTKNFELIKSNNSKELDSIKDLSSSKIYKLDNNSNKFTNEVFFLYWKEAIVNEMTKKKLPITNLSIQIQMANSLTSLNKLAKLVLTADEELNAAPKTKYGQVLYSTFIESGYPKNNHSALFAFQSVINAPEKTSNVEELSR